MLTFAADVTADKLLNPSHSGVRCATLKKHVTHYKLISVCLQLHVCRFNMSRDPKLDKPARYRCSALIGQSICLWEEFSEHLDLKP